MTEICKNQRTMAAAASITSNKITDITDVFCSRWTYRVTRGSFISFHVISFHLGSILLNYSLLLEIHVPVMMTADELVFQLFVRFDS